MFTLEVEKKVSKSQVFSPCFIKTTIVRITTTRRASRIANIMVGALNG